MKFRKRQFRLEHLRLDSGEPLFPLLLKKYVAGFIFFVVLYILDHPGNLVSRIILDLMAR